MTRIESELHDLYECLMRNDDMADRDAYYTIVGIANDVAEMEAENERLRKLVQYICDENYGDDWFMEEAAAIGIEAHY